MQLLRPRQPPLLRPQHRTPRLVRSRLPPCVPRQLQPAAALLLTCPHLLDRIHVRRAREPERALGIRPAPLVNRAVLNALLPVVLAVMLLLLVTCMYAIAATETLHQQSPDHFGTVGESYVTLLQMLTGDAWARQVKLPSLATGAL